MLMMMMTKGSRVVACGGGRRGSGEGEWMGTRDSWTEGKRVRRMISSDVVGASLCSKSS